MNASPTGALPYNNLVEITFPYGDTVQVAKLPEGLSMTVASQRPMERLEPALALREALANPTGAPPLNIALRGKKSCVIAVTDHTRQNGYQLWLNALLNHVNDAGIADKDISLFIASAMRGPMSEAEKREYFGDKVIDRLATHDHDPATATLIKAGRTDFGTVLEVNKVVYEAEALILTGGIQYHNFAGYTGGREAILPGACGMSSINSNFKRALDSQGNLRPEVRPGVMSGNPFSDDMHEACVLIKPTFYIDVIMNADNEVAWLGGGDFGYVPRLGAKFLDEHSLFKLPQPAEVALIGAGPGRSGNTLYRAHKSLRQVERALAPGASVIWVARCERGEGPPMLGDWRDLELEEVQSRSLRQGTLIGLAALVIKQMARRFRIHMVTELPGEVVSAWGMKKHDTLATALAAAAPGFPAKAHWLVGADMSDLLCEAAQAGTEAA